MSELDRRALLTGAGALALTQGCALRASEAEWCLEDDAGGSQINDDGPFPSEGDCQVTASQIEGPFYSANSQSAADIVEHDDAVIVTLSGRVFESGCAAALVGALVEIWHTDPDGEYDSVGTTYRTGLTTDADGNWSLRTVRPGAYLNGTAYRPAHYHVQVWVDGVERLTTQLYLEGDEYLACDPFANTSLVCPWTGSEEDGIHVEMDFVLA